ncbi:hypothetical protein HJG54_27405 [Leptolyngbya sp. NK1-12]|uniref:Glycosyltransferase RgtA/B/C/D-like domain-containing protein n=1 Tax=Leptolyngbya sp. NK1-12 TaxID=2547451 RepID=A0AA96WNX9_9CYAN|nr:hypothetical protein [Leptolyngbya sp. NK1-12]WNZ26181.1 hypothetical protein HJG54_27405 [Leptolyngbya sp. NK1-12]
MVGLWLGWLLLIWSYQAVVTARYDLQRPDRVLGWTADSTKTEKTADRPYLNDPFLNTQVGWDSEFYLSIALHGYDDPKVRSVPPAPDAEPPFNRPLSLNYAFFPGYPYLIRWLVIPLAGLGLSPIATATLAGLIISALGTLIGLIALYDLATYALGEYAGLRAAFYLLSFPTGFFLAQVYTEGLFVGLAFSSLALIQRKYWLPAALLAALATLTRAVGIFLLIPLLFGILRSFRFSRFSGQSFTFRGLLQFLVKLISLSIPLAVYLYWRNSFLGDAFQIVEDRFFNCRLFDLQAATMVWRNGFMALFGDNSATVVHYGIEFAAIALGFCSCLITLKHYPGLSLYGLAILSVSLTCGTAWSMTRYLLTIPSVFLVLAHWGQSQVFDRLWSLASILLLAMFTALFSFNFWAG